MSAAPPRGRVRVPHERARRVLLPDVVDELLIEQADHRPVHVQRQDRPLVRRRVRVERGHRQRGPRLPRRPVRARQHRHVRRPERQRRTVHARLQRIETVPLPVRPRRSAVILRRREPIDLHHLRERVQHERQQVRARPSTPDSSSPAARSSATQPSAQTHRGSKALRIGSSRSHSAARAPPRISRTAFTASAGRTTYLPLP
jgi:hypothetical protein